MLKPLALGAFSLSISILASPVWAGGPSKSEIENGVSGCPDGQNLNDDGHCTPSQNDRMGFDLMRPADAPQHPPALRAHPVAATSQAPAFVNGLLDLHMKFASASWQLTDGDKDTIRRVARLLTASEYAGKIVEIGGHTSSDGSPERNMLLSQRRADAVKDCLVQDGVPAERLKSVGYGSSKPANPDNTEAPENRRVVLTVVGTKSP
jgi:outer membrane protein OmpA-like peptidoglycan-associated protein